LIYMKLIQIFDGIVIGQTLFIASSLLYDVYKN
jgi:hypothetical protein